MTFAPKVGVGFGTILLKDGKILLGRRHEDPEKADSEMHGEGTWTIPGGKLDFGEGLEDGAYRETLEETGIKLNKEKIKLISLSNDRVTDAHFITLGFICDDFEGEAKVMEPDEITEWQWFDFNNLSSPIFSPTAKVIKNYLAGVIYQA